MGDFLSELWAFMKERKKFWLLPIIVMLVLLGSLIVLTQGSAVVKNTGALKRLIQVTTQCCTLVNGNT